MNRSWGCDFSPPHTHWVLQGHLLCPQGGGGVPHSAFHPSPSPVCSIQSDTELSKKCLKRLKRKKKKSLCLSVRKCSELLLGQRSHPFLPPCHPQAQVTIVSFLVSCSPWKVPEVKTACNSSQPAWALDNFFQRICWRLRIAQMAEAALVWSLHCLLSPSAISTLSPNLSLAQWVHQPWLLVPQRAGAL